MAIAFASIAAAYFIILEGQLHWRQKVALSVLNGAEIENNGGIQWTRWSVNAVAAARSSGKPVLVDFTADWCLTCQLNKKTSLEIDSVRAKLKEIGAVTLVGDYTLEDPAITQELKRFQRAGVPLVLVYPADAGSEPIVLPEALTPGIVLNALDRASQSKSRASAQ